MVTRTYGEKEGKAMSSIKDLTYHQLKEHRRLFENALSFATDDASRLALGKAIEGIESEMNRRHRKTVLSMVVTVNILVLALSGCNTAKGLMEDGAWLLNTGAENINTEK
jgi:predicted small secreted protein